MPDLEFSTLAVEKLAQAYMETLLGMRGLLMTSQDHQEVTLELADGHTWRVSRALGLIGVKFLCPGDGPHMEACVPPEGPTVEDIMFLSGISPGEDK